MSKIVSRRDFLRTAAIGSAGLMLGSRARAGIAGSNFKPNLVVFLPDQQRPDTLACYGGSGAIAPNLNKLARQSFVFENTYVTDPLCTPSRSSLLTGTWPHANGCTRNNLPLPRTVPCLPELIGDPDYRYAYMGKWHLGEELSMQRGFTDWISIMEGRVTHYGELRNAVAASDYDRFLLSKGVKPDLVDRGLFSRRFVTQLPLELSKPKFLEASACEFIEQHRRQPFVLFVGFYEPHPPYNGPLNEEHPLDEISLDPTADHLLGSDAPLRYRLRQEYDQQRYGRAQDRHLKMKQRYLGLVSEVDRAIGGILTKLEQSELLDRTIVVHTSDHGDMMGAHQMFGKEVMFQEAVRVPWLIRLPGQRRMGVIDQQISHIDFVPTVLDLMGKQPEEQCAGTSRAAWMRGEDCDAETVFIQRSPVARPKAKEHTRLADAATVKSALLESTRVAISADGWKLCLRDRDKNELYNLAADPGERQNLYSHRESRTVSSRRTKEIHEWQAKKADKVPLS